MVKRIDLRIHAGAPSSRQDDETYKAQAASYFGFELNKVIPITAEVGFHSQNQLQQRVEATTLGQSLLSRNDEDEFAANGVNSGMDDPIFLDDTQAAVLALQSQLFASSIIVPETVIPKRRRTVDGDDYGFGNNGHSPIINHFSPQHGETTSASRSDPSDSSRLKTPALHRTAKRRRTEGTTQNQATAAGEPSLPFVPTLGHDRLAISHIGQESDTTKTSQQRIEEQDSGGHTITSQLPTSYSLSEIDSGSSRAKSHGIQRSISDPGPTTTSLGQLSESREQSSPSGRSHSGSGRGSAEAKHQRADEGVTSTGDCAELPNAALRSNTALSRCDHAGTTPSIIFPPPPTPSLNHFKSHVTDALRSLTTTPVLAHVYAPQNVTREIEPNERGFWTFSAASWPEDRLSDFWTYLGEVVGKGRAGPSVLCILGAENLEADGALIKVYCWGEVVKHMYLLLFVASQGKVRKMGPRWIDSDEKVIVEMATLDRS